MAEASQTARELTRRIYAVTSEGSFARDFGLRDQMRRAAVSMMSNSAEGFESLTQALFIRYVGHAKAFAGELRAQLYIALDVGHLDQAQFDTLYDQADTCSRQLRRFITYREAQPNARRIHEAGTVYEIGE